VCWYLYILHDAEPFVVALCGLDGEPFLDAIDFPASPSLIAQSKQSTFYAAHSFEEFLYRFWIENTIWFCLDLGIQLTGDQLKCVRSMQPDFKDPHAA
jgi:hypothetical protein